MSTRIIILTDGAEFNKSKIQVTSVYADEDTTEILNSGSVHSFTLDTHGESITISPMVDRTVVGANNE